MAAKMKGADDTMHSKLAMLSQKENGLWNERGCLAGVESKFVDVSGENLVILNLRCSRDQKVWTRKQVTGGKIGSFSANLCQQILRDFHFVTFHLNVIPVFLT